MPPLLMFCASIALLIPLAFAERAAAEPVLISERGSERATTGPGNNIVTHDGKTHVVWQDAEKPGTNGYVNRVRTLDRQSGRWSPAVTLGPGIDNHARPTIAIDSQGRLHVVLSGHNTMMVYRRSVRPNDASEWSKPEPIDAGTYPMLACGPEDVLVVAARSKTHSGVNLYLKQTDDSAWETRKDTLRRNARYKGYAGYNTALAWGTDGVLHLSADVFEGYASNRGAHQSILYMKSRDLGMTWQKADGTPLSGKVDPAEADVLAEFDVGPKAPAQPARLRNGGVAVDSSNRPYVYFTEAEEGLGRTRLMTFDDQQQWQDLPLAAAVQKQWPNATVLGARGHLTIADNALHVLVEFSPKTPPGTTVQRFTRKIGVGLLTSRDSGRTFEARELLAIDPARHLSQVGLERQTGHNDLSGRLPGLIVTDGLQRYPIGGEVIQNKVFWIQP